MCLSPCPASCVSPPSVCWPPWGRPRWTRPWTPSSGQTWCRGNICRYAWCRHTHTWCPLRRGSTEKSSPPLYYFSEQGGAQENISQKLSTVTKLFHRRICSSVSDGGLTLNTGRGTNYNHRVSGGAGAWPGLSRQLPGWYGAGVRNHRSSGSDK